MNKTQKELVKRVIETRPLSSMEAFSLFGITRLAAVIFELRQEGLDIVSIHVKADAVEAVLTMGEVKRLLKELKRIETDNQLFMAENRLLMRQIEAYEMKEEEKLKDLREGNRAAYRRRT